MKLFERFKKGKESTELTHTRNFPKPFFIEDDFIEIYYLLKKELNKKLPKCTHYIHNIPNKEYHKKTLLSISQYDFFYNYFYDNVTLFFENMFVKEEFDYLLKYSNYDKTKKEIFDFVKIMLLKDYFKNIDLLKSRLDRLTNNRSFYNTYNPFTNDILTNHFIAEQVLQNLTIIDSGKCKIQFGTKNNYEKIILNFASLHISQIRIKPETFDLKKIKLEINRLQELKKQVDFYFLNYFIIDLNNLTFDLKDLYPSHIKKENKLTEVQMINLIELLKQWFPNNNVYQINNLISSILGEINIITEVYQLKINVNEFCFLLTFLIKKEFTSKKQVEKLIKLRLFKHPSAKLNIESFRIHFSTYDINKSLIIHSKSSNLKILYITFTKLFN